MDGIELITAGGMAALILELIKYLIRLKKKDFEYDFAQSFYLVMIPILSFASRPILAWLGLSGFEIPLDWIAWAKELIVVALSSLAAVFAYTQGIKPIKNYVRK